MLAVVSSTFTVAFGADFTFQIRGLGLSQCHSALTPFFRSFFPWVTASDSLSPAGMRSLCAHGVLLETLRRHEFLDAIAVLLQ